MSRERSETGRYTETVAPEDVLSVFERLPGPVVTSGDVAESLDCSRETARRKLRALEEQGVLASRKAAGRVVWWLADGADAGDGTGTGDPLLSAPAFSVAEPVGDDEIDDVLYGETEG